MMNGESEVETIAKASCSCLPMQAQQAIMVIEDDPDVTKIIKTHITRTGLYSVDSARNVPEALAMFKPGKYFAVILDLHLGISTDEGINLAVRFRDLDDNVFLAALSGYYPLFDERLLQCVDDFLRKPIDYDFLLSKLLMWQIKHSRRMALKHYVEERVVSYKKCLSEIREEEELLKEMLSDLLKRTGYSGEGDVDGGASD